MSAEYALTSLPSFIRAAARFVRKHPDLTQRLDNVLAQLRQDPFAPSLRPHALSGALDGLQAVSVSYAYRIVLCVEVKEHEIILHNIGTHDEVYG